MKYMTSQRESVSVLLDFTLLKVPVVNAEKDKLIMHTLKNVQVSLAKMLKNSIAISLELASVYHNMSKSEVFALTVPPDFTTIAILILVFANLGINYKEDSVNQSVLRTKSF